MNLRNRAVLIAGVAALLASAGQASAQVQVVPGQGARTIRVTGMGEVRVEPDLASIQFAVETTGSTAREAGEANADQMDRVVAALLQAGVARSDIQTSGYSLYPEYAQQRDDDGTRPPTIVGYRAMNMVSVRTRELERVGALIDVGLAAGANRLHGIGFEVTDSRAAESQALQRAVQAARSSAETMAQALGVTLGPVLDASTNSEPPRPYYRAVAQDMAMVGRASAAMTPIEAGEQTITAQASVVFEIR